MTSHDQDIKKSYDLVGRVLLLTHHLAKFVSHMSCERRDVTFSICQDISCWSRDQGAIRLYGKVLLTAIHQLA